MPRLVRKCTCALRSMACALSSPRRSGRCVEEQPLAATIVKQAIRPFWRALSWTVRRQDKIVPLQTLAMCRGCKTAASAHVLQLCGSAARHTLLVAQTPRPRPRK